MVPPPPPSSSRTTTGTRRTRTTTSLKTTTMTTTSFPTRRALRKTSLSSLSGSVSLQIVLSQRRRRRRRRKQGQEEMSTNSGSHTTRRIRTSMILLSSSSTTTTTELSSSSSTTTTTTSSSSSSSSTHQEQKQRQQQEPEQKEEEDSVAAYCPGGAPYYKKFPRYTIDLISPTQQEKKQRRNTNNNNNDNLAQMRSFLDGFIMSSSSSSSSRRRRSQSDNEKMMNTWMKHVRRKEQKQQQQRQSSVTASAENQHNLNLEWHDEQDGIHAMTTLFRMAMNLTTTTTTTTTTVMIGAFPDVTSTTIQNFVRITNWIIEQQQQQQQQRMQQRREEEEEAFTADDGGPSKGASPTQPASMLLYPSHLILRAEYVDDYYMNIPSIRLVCQQQRQVLDDKDIGSPSTATTNKYTHEIITKRTMSWVKRILVNRGICPFTKSTKMSGHGLQDLGIPVARIAYHTSYSPSNNVFHLMADTFDAIHNMIQVGPGRHIDVDGNRKNSNNIDNDGISSILLAAPEYDGDFDLFSGPVFTILQSAVVAANAHDDADGGGVGVVCFHPKYATPDGTTWPGFGHMHSVPRLQKWILDEEQPRRQQQPGDGVDSSSSSSSSSIIANLSYNDIAAGGAYQRRTPHSVINVLWSKQLSIAENRRNTPALYKRNIMKLIIGGDNNNNNSSRSNDDDDGGGVTTATAINDNKDDNNKKSKNTIVSTTRIQQLQQELIHEQNLI